MELYRHVISINQSIRIFSFNLKNCHLYDKFNLPVSINYKKHNVNRDKHKNGKLNDIMELL